MRELFPITRNYIYLNHAAVAPYSTRVVDAIRRLVDDITVNGSVNWHSWTETLKRCRKLYAELVGAKDGQIAFVRNTSDGISAIANGFNWKKGDNVVSCDIEFPANIYPWMNLASKGVELRLAKSRDGRIEAEDVFELIDERTRVVSLSWVQYSSGFRADIATIGRFCRAREILFVLDAIQGLGALKLDVEAACIDAFAADAHKFLMGPEGLGILYLSDRAMQKVTPSIVGWMSVKDWWRCFDEDFKYRMELLPNALRFECGTPNTLGAFGAEAAVQLILEVGPQKIEDYLLDLCAYLSTRLQEIGFEIVAAPRNRKEASSIVCCKHKVLSAENLCRQLEREKIITAYRCGSLRISPHFYNDQSDIDRLIAALEKIKRAEI
ncbi:MAG: aminotransferase class V-fold PLP-dependent enzyme [Acidobacteriota bacterium]|nr:aminotransferase class V-fold PLP-dependent enzyme [Blastocatellia bacterium]MDW8412564.1 aminotransferase class V-fold PLP-dependent enzyme [Acidobacteriota bacterium]